MDLREYQNAVAKTDSVGIVARMKMLAKVLRYVTATAAIHGYSLEELASLDMEDQ